jgi:hypothetical protein
MKHKLKPLNKPLFLYGLFILVNIIYLPLNLRDGVGFVIGISIVYINLLFIYSIKDRISILQILKYSIFIISPLVLFNLYLSFDNSFYSHKHQFFGIYSNANIFGIFLVFSLTLLVLSKDLINRHISLFLLISIFYLIMITISRSTMIASLPLFYLYFYNIKLKYIFLLIISLIILFIIQDNLEVTQYIIKRIQEVDSREHGLMFEYILSKNFLPSGPVSFHIFMNEQNIIADNSYFELLYNYGLLSILFFSPFIYISIFLKEIII